LKLRKVANFLVLKAISMDFFSVAGYFSVKNLVQNKNYQFVMTNGMTFA
jgi:hypothetical protein